MPLSDLPEEILFVVLSNLNDKSRKQLRKCAKQFRFLLNRYDEHWWKLYGPGIPHRKHATAQLLAEEQYDTSQLILKEGRPLFKSVEDAMEALLESHYLDDDETIAQAAAAHVIIYLRSIDEAQSMRWREVMAVALMAQRRIREAMSAYQHIKAEQGFLPEQAVLALARWGSHVTWKLFLEAAQCASRANRYRAFLGAAANGQVKCMRVLSDQGVPWSYVSERDSASNVAAYHGQVSVLQLLIDQGVDPLFVSVGTTSALTEAASAGKIFALEFLLQRREPTVAEVEEAFSMAVAKGQLHSLVALKPYCLSLLERRAVQWLLGACVHLWPSSDVIKFLVRDMGIYVDRRDMDGDTALHAAVRAGHAKSLEPLLDLEAQANIKDSSGQDCFELAYSNERRDCASILSRRYQPAVADAQKKRSEKQRIAKEIVRALYPMLKRDIADMLPPFTDVLLDQIAGLWQKHFSWSTLLWIRDVLMTTELPSYRKLYRCVAGHTDSRLLSAQVDNHDDRAQSAVEVLLKLFPSLKYQTQQYRLDSATRVTQALHESDVERWASFLNSQDGQYFVAGLHAKSTDEGNLIWSAISKLTPLTSSS